jgi:hypothetical protein
MTSSTKWHGTRTGITFESGSTLTNTAGTVNVTTTALDVTGAATVGTTLGVTGDLAVKTNSFVVTATTGNVVSKGTFTAGLVASGKAIILDPAGSTSVPAATCIQLFTDGSDLYATRQADSKTAKLTTGTWSV